jgi:hypothetical protein
MNTALLAALCMIFQDVLGTVMVQAEARNHGWIAGICDTVMWLFAIATTAISVTALQGHNLHQKILVIVFVSGANLIGSRLGVLVGNHLVKEQVVCTCCKIHKLKVV